MSFVDLVHTAETHLVAPHLLSGLWFAEVVFVSIRAPQR